MSSVTAKVDAFFTKYPERTYPKGQILVFADESPEHIYYLTAGRVRVYDVTYRGDEIVLNTFKPGAFFPMSWAINHSPNKFFYKTETKTELHIVPTKDVLEFIKSNSDVMFDLLSRIYYGTDGLLGRVVQLMAGTARTRLIYELIIEGRRFGEKMRGGVISLAITEVDLAAKSGLSRETVSREMQKLKEQQQVSLTGKVILIKDIGRLEALLRGD